MLDQARHPLASTLTSLPRDLMLMAMNYTLSRGKSTKLPSYNEYEWLHRKLWHAHQSSGVLAPQATIGNPGKWSTVQRDPSRLCRATLLASGHNRQWLVASSSHANDLFSGPNPCLEHQVGISDISTIHHVLIDQKAGDLVIVDGGACYQTRDHGPNVSLDVNYIHNLAFDHIRNHVFIGQWSPCPCNCHPSLDSWQPAWYPLYAMESRYYQANAPNPVYQWLLSSSTVCFKRSFDLETARRLGRVRLCHLHRWLQLYI